MLARDGTKPGLWTGMDSKNGPKNRLDFRDVTITKSHTKNVRVETCNTVKLSHPLDHLLTHSLTG